MTKVRSASKTNQFIPYGRQLIDEEDIRAVVNVLKSDWITQGPKVNEFEEKLAKYCGAKYAVAVSNGTAALHLACLAVGLKKGDEAITTPITFLATPNSILYAGAKPIFADIDYSTGNIDPEEVKKKINKKTKAILPVHFSGLPCDMLKLSKIAKKNNLTIIEDACHALGAEYKCKGRWVRVGSCRHSDMTVFSFHPVKHITAGEGGAITTNDRKLYKKLIALRSHGIYKDEKTDKFGPWYYEMRDLGFNYRITDFQCALGIAQLKKLNTFLNKRREIVKKYNHAFKGIDSIETPHESSKNNSVYHLYILKINFKNIGTKRKSFMENLKKDRILTQVHYIPIYRQPYYKKKYSLRSSDFNNAEKYYKRTLSLPIYPGMKDSDVRHVIDKVKGLI